MKNKSYLFVVLLWGTLSPSNGYAQTKDSIDRSEEIQLHPFSQNNSFQNPADISPDRQYKKDSTDILKWKKNREFSYMRYLDSLLRNEKNLQADTVSVDEKSGRITRKKVNPTQPSPFNNMLNSWPLKIFFWVLAILFILLISYKVLFKNGIFIRKKKLHRSNEEKSFEELHESSEYDFLAGEAENKNELNVATRFLFLKTLKNLSDKGFINFTSEKTNKDYLNEIRNYEYREELSNLMRDYEYIWYGKFSIDKEQYQKIKEDFSSFNKKL